MLTDITNHSKNHSKQNSKTTEILNNLKKLEIKIDPDYILTQEELSWKTRLKTLQKMHKKWSNLNLRDETFFFAVNLFDRFLTLRSVTAQKINLVATTALFIAAKYEEIHVPPISKFSNEEDELKQAEMYVFYVMEGNVEFPTPISFIKCLILNDYKCCIYKQNINFNQAVYNESNCKEKIINDISGKPYLISDRNNCCNNNSNNNFNNTDSNNNYTNSNNYSNSINSNKNFNNTDSNNYSINNDTNNINNYTNNNSINSNNTNNINNYSINKSINNTSLYSLSIFILKLLFLSHSFICYPASIKGTTAAYLACAIKKVKKIELKKVGYEFEEIKSCLNLAIEKLKDLSENLGDEFLSEKRELIEYLDF